MAEELLVVVPELVAVLLAEAVDVPLAEALPEAVAEELLVADDVADDEAVALDEDDADELDVCVG